MKSTRTSSTLNLNFASEAPPPDLPAVAPEPAAALAPVAAAAQPTRTIVQKPLTTETLTEMLTHRRKRTDGWTPIRVGSFIEALAETGSVTKAAAYADMSVAAAYHLRNHPDAIAFREAWDSAMATRFEALTEIAMDRVTNGVAKTRWCGDQEIGRDFVFSDRLLIHMLNRSDPDRDRSLPVAGEARLCRQAAPRAGALPLADDFVVSAGTETGKLGWDPDDDEYELDPETAADVAAIHAREAERVAAAEAALAARRAEERAVADRLNAERAEEQAMRDEDEAWEREHADLSRASKFSSSNPVAGLSRRRRH